jgi:hypothetical protein
MTDYSIDSIYNKSKDATMQDNTIKTIDTTMQATQSPFDINLLFSAAILNAVNTATAPLVQRIAVLERSLVVADKAAQGNESDLYSRVVELEEKLKRHNDGIEERIKEIAEEVAEAAICEHNDLYDHDGYDRLEDKIDDAVAEMDIETEVKRALSGASISIHI